jgi:hypothetical protein
MCGARTRCHVLGRRLAKVRRAALHEPGCVDCEQLVQGWVQPRVKARVDVRLFIASCSLGKHDQHANTPALPVRTGRNALGASGWRAVNDELLAGEWLATGRLHWLYQSRHGVEQQLGEIVGEVLHTCAGVGQVALHKNIR